MFRILIYRPNRSRSCPACCILQLSPPFCLPPARLPRMTSRSSPPSPCIADMARNVAGDAGDVVSVTKPGAEIHGYRADPAGSSSRAQDADLILWNGLNLERWFEQFLTNLGDVPSATLSDGIDPMPIREGGYEGKPNPHAWMGLDNAMIYVDNIADALSAADPANAAAYAANAEAYKAQTARRHRPAARQHCRPAGGPALAGHLRRRVSATLPAILACMSLSLADQRRCHRARPQQVRAVIDAVRENAIPAVFCESTVNHRPGRTGRPRNRCGLWRRAVCRQPVRCRRPGADLSRPVCGSPPKPWPRA